MKTEMNPVLLKIAEVEDDSEKVLKAIDKELTRTKFACFGKVKIHSKSKEQKSLENLQMEKLLVNNNPPENHIEIIQSIDQEMATTLKEIERNKLEKDMRQLENLKENKGRAAAVFSLKDKILGKKKVSQDQVVLTDPVTGKDVYTPAEIKRVSLDYLVNILKTEEPSEKYAEEVARRKEVHYERMEEIVPDDLEELPEETFWKTLVKLEQRPGSKYEFITKAGSSLKFALLNLFKII